MQMQFRLEQKQPSRVWEDLRQQPVKGSYEILKFSEQLSCGFLQCKIIKHTSHT